MQELFKTGEIRIVEVIASDYEGFGPGGLVEELRLGFGALFQHHSAFKRIAVVFDELGLPSAACAGVRLSALRRRSVLLLGWLVFQGIPIEVRIPQSSGRRIVDHDRDVRMQLEHRCRAACGERTLDGRRDRRRLVTRPSR